MIKVTIIVPVYNVAPYLYSCLNSIANQTYHGPIECIVVDDCGQDNSIQIAEDFISSYQGDIEFKIIHRAVNGGLSAARNTGLEHATGDYVYFMDSDDLITPSCIYSLTQPLNEEPYDFVIGNFETTNLLTWSKDFNLKDGTILRNESIFFHYTSHDWYGMAWNKLVNLDLLQKNNLLFKEGIIYEDMHWSYRLALAAKSMRVVDSTCYIYNIHDGSIVTSSSPKRKSSCTKLILIEMMDLARKTDTIFNINVYDYIQKWFSYTFNWSNSVSANFCKQTYTELSEGLGITPLQFIKYCHFKPKRIIRDLHFVFPSCIGYFMAYFIYIKIPQIKYYLFCYHK